MEPTRLVMIPSLAGADIKGVNAAATRRGAQGIDVIQAQHRVEIQVLEIIGMECAGIADDKVDARATQALAQGVK